MNLKFEPMKFHFNSAGAMAEIEEAISIALDELSYQFQQIFIEEIYANGNGSHIMKDEAVRHVKEISRKNDGGIIELEVGVDENISGERERIRTVVVLHGNLNSGPLFTKPGNRRGGSMWRTETYPEQELYITLITSCNLTYQGNCLKTLRKRSCVIATSSCGRSRPM